MYKQDLNAIVHCIILTTSPAIRYWVWAKANGNYLLIGQTEVFSCTTVMITEKQGLPCTSQTAFLITSLNLCISL